MKKLKLLCAIKCVAFYAVLFASGLLHGQGVVITEDSKEELKPHVSAIFDVRATDKGILIPRLTTEQLKDINTPADGLLIYNTDEKQFFYYNAQQGKWVKAVGPQGPQGPEGFLQDGTAEGNVPYWDGTEWILSSNNLFHDGTNVGIGTNTPITRFHVRGSGTNAIQTITNIQDQLSALALNTQWRTWLIGQNRPPGEAVTDAFFIHDVNSNNTRFLIDIAGNVGIGTTAPTRRLDVNGNVRLRAHLVDANNTLGTTGQVLTRGASGVLWADPEGSVGGSGTAGKIAYWESATDLSALPFMRYNEVNQFVEVTSKAVADDDDPIFEVKNKDGQVVFGVYQTGVRIYVDDSPDKTSRGGFAVGGFTAGKDKANLEYLRVTPDSVRVYVMDGNDKTSRGGFAVGGFTAGKGFQELLRITSDSARVYVSDDPSKTSRGGFAVGGFTAGKTFTPASFMHLTPENYFIGHESGINLVHGSGVYNNTMGYQTGKNLTTGKHNIFIGYQSGFNSTGATSNTFIGNYAGYINTEGVCNVFIGERAGYASDGYYGTPSVGSFNTYIGYYSGNRNASGVFNVMLGNRAGWNKTAGDSNVMVGSGAGSNNATGSGNVFLGNNAGRDETGSNKLYIANAAGTPLIYGDFSNNRVGLGTTNPSQRLTITGNIRLEGGNRWLYFTGGDGVLQVDETDKSLWFHTGGAYNMVLRNTGNLGINTNSPGLALHVRQRVNNRGIRIQHNTDADYWNMGVGLSTKHFRFEFNDEHRVNISSVDGTYSSFSDIRMKDDIKDIGPILDKVMRLKPSSYYIKDTYSEKRSIGFISQEVEELFPELVSTSDDDYKFLAYSHFSVIAIKAIQEQQEMIREQQKLIQVQESEIKTLNEKIKEIDELKKRLNQIESAINVNN